MGANHIKFFDWPAKSPDLNLFENLCDQRVRRVYANGRQHNSTVDLQDAVMGDWNSIDSQYK